MQDGIAMAKIVDYGKFLFKQQKQQAQSKGNQKKTELKTTKLTYKIGDHDDLAVARIEEFIASVESFYRKDEKSKVLKQGNTFNIILYPKK